MHAIATLHEADSAPADLTPRLRSLVEEHRSLWNATGESPPVAGPRVTWRRRLANGRASRRLVDDLALEIERCPPAGAAREAWKLGLQERVRAFGERRLGWPAGYRRLLVGDDFFATSEAFVRRARAFDPDIAWPDVGQALRNVWIANSVQMLLDAPVELTPALFAYSMLYPYTDNLLDDPDVELPAKRAFNRFLEQRLRGRPAAPADGRQEAVGRLVGEIEAQYPRPSHPAVHGALLAIHAGQVRSLEQQAAGADLDAAALLEVSLAKGGASVLADGYLAAGTATPQEESFYFGYGAFLQLLDDLQDAREDAAVGHRTLFSVRVGRGPLDGLASRVHRFMHRIVDGGEAFGGPERAERRDLILRNCTFLFVAAVAEDPDLFSRGFRRALQRRWPLGFRAMRRLRRRASGRLRRAAESVRQRAGGGEGLWDSVT